MAFVSQQKSNIFMLIAIVVILATVFYLFNWRTTGLGAASGGTMCAYPKNEESCSPEEPQTCDGDVAVICGPNNKFSCVDCASQGKQCGVGTSGPTEGFAVCCKKGSDVCGQFGRIYHWDQDCNYILVHTCESNERCLQISQ
ncbi:MAG: hypothetical protein AABY13_00810, partial [Nanoarchaeota archaeon]